MSTLHFYSREDCSIPCGLIYEFVERKLKSLKTLSNPHEMFGLHWNTDLVFWTNDARVAQLVFTPVWNSGLRLVQSDYPYVPGSVMLLGVYVASKKEIACELDEVKGIEMRLKSRFEEKFRDYFGLCTVSFLPYHEAKD